MLVYDAIEEETKEKAMPLYMALKITSMILRVEDKLPSFEEFIQKEEKQKEYTSRDADIVTKEYVDIAEKFRKVRE